MSVQKVFVSIKGFFVDCQLGHGFGLWVEVDGRKLEAKELEEFVRFDGFEDEFDFADYWVFSTITKVKDMEGAIRIEEHLDLFHWTDLKY